MADKCKQQVFDRFHHYGCSRNAVLDGYCKQHHPDAVAAKKAKLHAKWDAESAARRKRWDNEEKEQAHVAALRAWVVRQPCEQFGWEREQGNKFCGKCFPCLERKRAESAKPALIRTRDGWWRSFIHGEKISKHGCKHSAKEGGIDFLSQTSILY